jgi:hypothetical protein
VSQGKQTLGPDSHHVDQVLEVHRDRPPIARALRWLLDNGESSRCGIGDLSHQVNGAITGHVPVKAAFRTDWAVRLPPHDQTVSVHLSLLRLTRVRPVLPGKTSGLHPDHDCGGQRTPPDQGRSTGLGCERRSPHPCPSSRVPRAPSYHPVTRSPSRRSCRHSPASAGPGCRQCPLRWASC